MVRLISPLFLLAAISLPALLPRAAAAQSFCNGGLTVDGYTVLGEDKTHPGTLGVCNYNYVTGYVSYYQYSLCNTTTPLGDFVKITDFGGIEYAGTNSNVGLVVESGGIRCHDNSPGPYHGTTHIINPWPSSFHFGLRYTGYYVKAQVYGTPNRDLIYSFNYIRDTSTDGVQDFLCGYDGNDDIYGDYSTGLGDEECLDGGNGYDYCDGGADTTSEDQSRNCETNVSMRSTSALSCTCGTSPPNLWSTACTLFPGGC